MRAQVARRVEGSRLTPHHTGLEDRVLPALRVFFARKPFMTSMAAGLLSLAFICSTAPTAAQTLDDLKARMGAAAAAKEKKEKEEMQASPIYKKKYNECVLNHLGKARTKEATVLMNWACYSEAEIYYMEQKRR